MTNQEISALIPTLSPRPQIYYDLVRKLVADGFKFNHGTAEWSHENGERGRIHVHCKQTHACLQHPADPLLRRAFGERSHEIGKVPAA